MKFVAVTACPTGIAHSQMAAENLRTEAAERGHDIHVEVQGAMGTEDELSGDQIADADAVIIAADTSVSRDRFEGTPVVKGTVKDAVNDVDGLLDEAEAAAESADEEAVAEAEVGGADAAGETDTATSDSDSDDEARRPADRRSGDGLIARLKKMFS